MPWFEAGGGSGSPPPIKRGDVVEAAVYDDSGKPQGTILLGVFEVVEEINGGRLLSAMFLAAEDYYYHWWMNDGEGAPKKEKGYCHLCGKSALKCPKLKKHGNVVHSDRYRCLGQEPLTARKVPWLGEKTIRDGYVFTRAMFDGACGVGKRPAAMKEPGAKGARATWAAKGDDEGEDLEEEEESEEEDDEETSGSEDPAVKSKIHRLRDELKKAEEEASEKRKTKRAMKKSKKAASSRPMKAKGAVKGKKRRLTPQEWVLA